MGRSYKVIFQKSTSNPKKGTLYLRTINNRESSRKSLGIRITHNQYERYFIKEENRFRENQQLKSYTKYNEIIQKEISALRKKENFYVEERSNSFIDYWTSCISTDLNHGSRTKHITVLQKLKKFLVLNQRIIQNLEQVEEIFDKRYNFTKEELDSVDLTFEEISPELIRTIQYRFQRINDPKKLKDRTAIHYIKMIRLILNRATKENLYHYQIQPFATIKKAKTSETKKETLTKDEIKSLVNTSLEDYKLDLARKMFIFQIFGNGIRVSDVLKLKWRDLKNGRIHVKTLKTGEELSIPVNSQMRKILFSIIEDGTTELEYRYNRRFKTQGLPISSKYSFKIGQIAIKKAKEIEKKLPTAVFTFISDKLENEIELVSLGYWEIFIDLYLEERFGSIIDLELDSMREMGRFEQYFGYEVDKQDPDIKEMIDHKLRFEGILHQELVEKICEKASEPTNKDKFIFQGLENSLFENIHGNDFSNLSDIQYRAIKHRTIVYNRQLKKVQEQCGIQTHMTSHVPRHTFTQMLLSLEGVNVYDISEALGHQSINSTIAYIRSGFNQSKVDYLNYKISNSI